MTCLPNSDDSFCAMMRAATSGGPPAPKGTISLIGLDGYGCACAVLPQRNNSVAIASAALRMPLVPSIQYQRRIVRLRLDFAGPDRRRAVDVELDLDAVGVPEVDRIAVDV